MNAHPAGPLHAGVLPPAETAGPHPRDAADLDTLAPAVWPQGAHRGAEGAVEVAGVDVRDLAAEFGTPLFVVDEADFRARAAAFAGAFGASSVHYAAKAFLCTEVARWVADEGLSLDVCSDGELAVALRAGFPPGRITFHGNNKSMDELVTAVEAGVGCVVLDSFHEIARLDAVARERGTTAPVMIRLTVGVEAHTHEFIATAHEDQKFGFSTAGGAESDAAEAARDGETELLVLVRGRHELVRVRLDPDGQPDQHRRDDTAFAGDRVQPGDLVERVEHHPPDPGLDRGDQLGR